MMTHQFRLTVGRAFAAGVASLALAASCFAFPGGDIILSDIPGVTSYGPVNGIRAYILGSGTCNIGNQNLEWINAGSPAMAMNAFRLYDGRLMQIGLGNCKTACCVVNTNGCGMTCSSSGTGLRAGCKDTYSASFNANQSKLAPRSVINPYTGQFTSFPAITGDAIFRRLQVKENDLNPANFPGALYFVEGAYVSTGDAQNQNWLNNASYQRVTFSSYIMALAGSPYAQRPAIYAWFDHGNGLNTPDPSVIIQNVDVPSEGRFIAAYKVRNNGDGTWRYDYAIYNLNSHRSGGSFTVPVPAGVTVTNIGFNDVDYHSGEVYSNTDWNSTRTTSAVIWTSPQSYAENQNTNALRWGTMYNFWFTADRGPGTAQSTLGLFRPGTPTEVGFDVAAPEIIPCNGDISPAGGNGVVDVNDLLGVVNNWGNCPLPDDCPADINGDDVVNVADMLAVINAWGPCP